MAAIGREIERTFFNRTPVIADQTLTVTLLAGETSAPQTLTASDPDGDPLRYTATQPTSGATVDVAGGKVAYTPPSGWDGLTSYSDTFSVDVHDTGVHLHGLLGLLNFGMAGHDRRATVTVNVTAGTPTAVDDTQATDEDTPVTINVLGNDTNAAGATVTIAGGPTNGTAKVNADNTVTYTPAADYHGSDSFTYTATTKGASTATVHLTVNAVNDAPVISAVTSTPGIGNTWTVAVTATDVDSPTPTIDFTAADPTHVTVSKNNNGTYAVTADATWAKAHPGSQVLVNVTATDDQDATGTRTNFAIGTVNNAVGVGLNSNGQLNVPALPAGVTYTQVVAAFDHTVLLRSDGRAIAVGSNYYGQRNIPALPDGVTYTQVSASPTNTLLLRSDGRVAVAGGLYYTQADIPALPEGVTYTQVSAGYAHGLLLRSDGKVVTVGNNSYGQRNIPDLPDDVTYTQVSGGFLHTVLLRSDGTAIGVGNNVVGQISIPDLPDRVTYTQVDAGYIHTVLLRSDGTAVAVGDNSYGQLDIPTLPAGVTYTQVSAFDSTTVLLRSDGTAIGVGDNYWGQLNIPTLPAGVTYTQVSAGRPHTVLLTAQPE